MIMRADSLLSRCLRLGVQLICYTGRRLSVRTITWHLFAVEYHSRRMAWCHRLTLGHCWSHRQWAKRHRAWTTRQWWHCISTDESRLKLHHTDGRAPVHRRKAGRHIDVCVQGTDGNVRPYAIVLAGFHYGGKSKLAVVDSTMNQQAYRCLLQKSLSPEQLCPGPVSNSDSDSGRIYSTSIDRYRITGIDNPFFKCTKHK